MRSYEGFLLEAAERDVVQHLEHIEDAVIDDGSAGAKAALATLRNIAKVLRGSSKSKVNITLKYDGAPSIFAGTDPADGKFFVAKKSIFNKEPKVYKTAEEVKADTSGDLQLKMLEALRLLPALGIKGIIQGDFMFGPGDVKKATIGDASYVTFHPNTIVYAIPIDTPAAMAVLRAKIGIVWHTTYTGASLSTISSQSGNNIASKLRPSKDVWSVDASIHDISGRVNMTDAETKAIDDDLARLDSLIKETPAALLNVIASSTDLRSLIKIYANSKIRASADTSDSKKYVADMLVWLNARLDADVASKKTPAGQEKYKQKKESIISPLSKYTADDLAKIFSLMSIIVQIKLRLIAKLNETNEMRTFLKTTAGLQSTGHEGYVISDHLGSSTVKLVDRLNFSRANFSPDVIKGWQR